MKIVQAYWRLSTAQADYHWAIDQRERLKHHTRAHTNSAGTLSARASARADVRDMQLAVAQAQQDLVLAMGTWKDTSPPLAVDRPHVGAYRTEYETVFGNRAPPARVRLIHRTLPVLRQAIDAHCDAVIAAVDALEASGEHFETSGQGLDTILAVLDLLKRERRSFMNDVRDYNQDIAEYALNVAQPGANAKTLVSMLILPSEKGSKAKAAGATVPVGEPPAREPAAREMPADEPPAQEPQVQEAPNEEVPLEQQPAEEAPAQGGAPRELNPPPADEPLPEDNPLNQADQQGLDEQTSNYQHERPAGGHASPLGALLDVVDRPQRVQKLANLLHWDRNLPPETDGAAPLNECLRGTAGSGRLAVLAAYWRARERAARYEALNEHVEQLNLLPAIAVDIRNEPGMVEANVRLQAARQAAKAAVHDAHVALLAAQFELTTAAGGRLDEPWLLPTTAPQSGRYLVAGASKAGQDDPRARHWSQMIRLRHSELEERADAVLEADVFRAALMNEAQAHDRRAAAADEMTVLDAVIKAASRQTDETLAFLADLTAYNIAIAHYALDTLPASLPPDELTKMLVVARSTKREA